MLVSRLSAASTSMSCIMVGVNLFSGVKKKNPVVVVPSCIVVGATRRWPFWMYMVASSNVAIARRIFSVMVSSIAPIFSSFVHVGHTTGSKCM